MINLNSKITEVFRLNEKQKKDLEKLGLVSIQDLFFYFPTRYQQPGEIKLIKDLSPGEIVTIYGKIENIKINKVFRKKTYYTEAFLEDNTGKIKIIWLHQPFISKILKENELLKITGKVSSKNNKFCIFNPDFEKIKNIPQFNENLFLKEKILENTSFLLPVYPETSSLSSRWFLYTLRKAFSLSNEKGKLIKQIEEYIPLEILKKYKLPTIQTALTWIHFPRKIEETEVAKKRFSFEEIFMIQLERQHDRIEYQKKTSFKIKITEKEIKDFLKRFPFKITRAQQKAIKEIIEDMRQEKPMVRLLEGDVGSGKTLVAAVAAYAVIKSKPNDYTNLQVVYMAPTEVLITQHFESFIQYFKHLNINIGLITSSGCRKFPSKLNPSTWTNISKRQFLKWVANGEIPIVLGTHALIQKDVNFKNLALIIIDEQHRFGIAQRQKLVKKEIYSPHYLSMTATPIPRTLALTIYGDLDLSLIDEMPPGRKEVITKIFSEKQRSLVYEKVKEELKNGHQAYFVCPRIEENQKSKISLNLKSVEIEAEELKKHFPDYKIEILHSKLKKKEKEKIMKKFSKGEIKILVATSVIEVGINVPNATIIVIENGERFGLAQLHQLRGRVLRSTHQAYCFIFYQNKSLKSLKRLQALINAKNGFELAELDLKIRGCGELSGQKQWGISDLGMEAIKNIKMVEAARIEAKNIIEKDLELKNYPSLKEKLKKKLTEFHFE